MVVNGRGSLRVGDERRRVGRIASDSRGVPRVALLDGLPLLPVTPAVAEVAAAYVARKVMPADLSGDALHLALASCHRCEFLDTWNCRHLANANKFAHIRRVNVLLGLHVPSLATPLQLQEGSEND